jgi:methylthioribulose-1-phosphate dehydratase
VHAFPVNANMGTLLDARRGPDVAGLAGGAPESHFRRVPPRSFPAISRDLVAIGRRFYARGWVQGTSGNFSAVVSRKPLRVAITASSVHKGQMRGVHILQMNESAKPIGGGTLTPSAEARLHLEIVRRREAGAVLHTHSIWGTILSASVPHRDVVTIDGFEMLKGLSGVRTHEHAEHIPIVDNDQDMSRLAGVVGDTLDRNPDAHAFLLRRHGLYTWGDTLADAERHVEILEFLFETIGRSATFRPPGGEGKGHGSLENS